VADDPRRFHQPWKRAFDRIGPNEVDRLAAGRERHMVRSQFLHLDRQKTRAPI